MFKLRNLREEGEGGKEREGAPSYHINSFLTNVTYFVDRLYI